MPVGHLPRIMKLGRADPNLPVDCLRLTGRSDPCPSILSLYKNTKFGSSSGERMTSGEEE